MNGKNSFVKWFDEINIKNVNIVGGKNASLGEMIISLKNKDIKVPNGFATTSDAYYAFLKDNNLNEKIQNEIDKYHNDEQSLAKTGKNIRTSLLDASFSEKLSNEITEAYKLLSEQRKKDDIDVAVRSSATAEDLPDASFAGQQETFLNITGEKHLLEACKKCYASLFTDRAIVYREEHNYDHLDVALSIGIQEMVRSDKAGSGVMFTLDTETGFPNVVVINAAWGLGENVVQGAVNPDEYVVFKPLLKNNSLKPIIGKELGKKEKKLIYSEQGGSSTKNIDTSQKEQDSYVLNDDEILQLARWAVIIEEHYQKPMDIEWAKDGITNELYIVQSRPETVQSRKKAGVLKTYTLKEKGKKLLEGLSIGEAIASGKAQILKSAKDIDKFEDGSILITEITDPDWVPILKKSSGVITDRGGRTSHAAIVSRELGIPAVVGTNNATTTLKDKMDITLSCAEGDKGFIYEGLLDYDEKEVDIEHIPEIDTTIMINMGNPDAAFRWWKLPVRGIGLARTEFIINDRIKIHPMALVNFSNLKNKKTKKEIEELTKGYNDKTKYFVDNFAYGIAKLAASQYPNHVVVRMSDFKTNEYANLIGGDEFEKPEDNPMLGFRGAFRYYSKRYEKGFELECEAIKKVRDEIGLTNVIIMIPFCRTIEEADKVLDVLKKKGLKQGENGLKIYIMAEIPSNIILADEFADRFDGFSIGSNDLTQLVLGIDRDSEELSVIFDEHNKAIEMMIEDLIKTAHKKNRPVGICGQAPSDYPDFAEFLVNNKIDTMSINPDSVINVIEHISKMKRDKRPELKQMA